MLFGQWEYTNVSNLTILDNFQLFNNLQQFPTIFHIFHQFSEILSIFSVIFMGDSENHKGGYFKIVNLKVAFSFFLMFFVARGMFF